MASSLRDLISGSDVCTPSDGAGPSNAASSFVNVLLGGRTKQKQQLNELPGVGQAGSSLAPAPFQPLTADQAAAVALHGDLPSVPGFSHPSSSTAADVEAFLHCQHQQRNNESARPREFESIYRSRGGSYPAAAASAASAVHPFLQAFFRSGGNVAHTLNSSVPHQQRSTIDMSVPDKCRVRDRSTILARQVFADKGSEYADQQVGMLLHSLNIDPAGLPAIGMAMPGASWDAIYEQAGGAGRSGMIAGEHAAAAAAAAQAHSRGAPWVEEFGALSLDKHQARQQQQPGGVWAEQFQNEEEVAAGRVAGTTTEDSSWVDDYRAAAQAGTELRQQQRADTSSAMEQTKKLAETLASSTNPKFQNSKFLQFVSKMSRGELILEDNGVKEVSPAAAQWADEFTTNAAATTGAGAAGPSLWGEEFASFQAGQHPSAAWAQEFHNQTTAEPPQTFTQAAESTAWADQFASGLTADWAEEFSTASGNALPADVANWEDEYLRELEKLHSELGPRSSGQYRMAEHNPFLTDVGSFQKGKDLFRKGVLTEAVLALEAECQRNPGNSEAWRLLGTVQAENDDDVQAIAALNRAVAADPEDLDALLSLGVSHTNELEQSEALGYLREWIMRHPTHGTAAKHTPGPPDSSQAMSYVIKLYQGAAAASPQDADVHAALGVLCNLSRKYDGAVNAFKAALALRPQDYSLWNKLGATLANSARSSEALAAYQKALELKPNYMRAWTNMGISLANIGEYEASAQYYVRALALNRKAVAVWGYLRNSLTCAGREDLMEAAEQEELESLMNALPL